MHKARLEAFTDGVFAIIITIMVLEFRIPHGDSFQDLLPMWPKFLTYVMSFLYIGIYWANHHHMTQAIKTVNGKVLWANLALLFTISLVPFSTGWLGESHFAHDPTLAYGGVLLANGFAYFLLVRSLTAHHGKDSAIAKALGSDIKGKLSLLLYAAGMALSFVRDWMGVAVYGSVALIWLVPDRRIEKILH